MTVDPKEIEAWDTILITGNACSPHERFVDMECMVSTVSKDEEGHHIKVWPTGKQGNEGDGKIWFKVDDIEKVELLDREED